MQNKFIPIAAAFILATCGWAGTAETIYRQASPAVMTLYVQDHLGRVEGNGTAFMVHSSGLAVTAFHVIKGAPAAKVKFADGSTAIVKGVVDSDEERDLALIQIETSNRPTLKICSTMPLPGAESFVIGAPKGLDFAITQGIVNQIRVESGIRTIQFSAPVSPGNSGSPLLNADGLVIGVVSYQRNDGQNLNFASPGTYLSDLNWLARSKRLPVNSKYARTQSTSVTDWKPVDVGSTGLMLNLPSAPKTTLEKLSDDLRDVVSDFRSLSLQTDASTLTVTYFKFKPGESPTTLEVANEVKKQRKQGAIQIDGGKAENPMLMDFKPEGADTGHAVVASFAHDGVPMVEATAVLRQGDRLWLLVIRYAASSERGLEELKALFNGMKIRE